MSHLLRKFSKFEVFRMPRKALIAITVWKLRIDDHQLKLLISITAIHYYFCYTSMIHLIQKQHLNLKSQFADDTGLWARSKKTSLAANRLQRGLDALAEWCAKWRIKLNPEKTKLIMFSRIRKDTLFLYGIQLSYFPHAKFLGITFNHKFTFKNILERCQQKYHRMRILVNQK